ncbi:hypothetical protein RI138_01515 [Streptomyces sp. C11-1]|uniref:Agglutinin receptor n=1 Tax=Streptomyces durocortorensis TaxID=2811104 RepID=A0ABY9VP75_9ACTN|nr:hypothetical protein [Streptomyces durocortorensis]WNF25588.1 hypothetical protein RI138_01515 [Streptomyces durocortorensis]
MATPEFRPTHVVPRDGLPAWEAPDVSRPTDPLDALLPVQLLDRRGDWAYVGCSNGWSAWVDGRLLVSVPQTPPAPGQPLARTADPRPLLARTEESLSEYRRAAQDLAEGRSDGEAFRQRTRGRRVGVVVDGESVWLYDAEHERWVFCDGTQLSTYAAQSGPGASQEGAGREGAAPEGAGGAGARGAGARPEGAGHAAAGQARDGGGLGAHPAEDGPEPTRVVPAEGPEPARVVSTDGPEPTRVVPAEGPEPTRVVPPEGPEPTRVVPADAPDPTDVVPAEGPEPTRVVPPDAPEPTRAAPVAGADEPRGGGASGNAGR